MRLLSALFEFVRRLLRSRGTVAPRKLQGAQVERGIGARFSEVGVGSEAAKKPEQPSVCDERPHGSSLEEAPLSDGAVSQGVWDSIELPTVEMADGDEHQSSSRAIKRGRQENNQSSGEECLIVHRPSISAESLLALQREGVTPESGVDQQDVEPGFVEPACGADAEENTCAEPEDEGQLPDGGVRSEATSGCAEVEEVAEASRELSIESSPTRSAQGAASLIEMASATTNESVADERGSLSEGGDAGQSNGTEEIVVQATTPSEESAAVDSPPSDLVEAEPSFLQAANEGLADVSGISVEAFEESATTLREQVDLKPLEGSGPEESTATVEGFEEEAPQRTGPRARHRTPRTTPVRVHIEPSNEFAVSESELERLPQTYRAWNTIIAKRLLLEGRESDTSFLTITPGVLKSLARDMGGTGDGSEESFQSIIAEAYRRRVFNHRGRLRVLRRCGEDGIPECIGFLALSVLAAYYMHSDDEAAGHAYYIRLADLLGVEQAAAYPIGFDPDVFESLWRFTGSWLQSRSGRTLALPGDDVGFRRIIAIPLAHVPLRTIDIERLPSFFYSSGYEPGSRASIETIDRDLRRWNAQSVLTDAGAAALLDQRRPAVLVQIASELECWDGAVSEAAIRRRSAVVELLLDARPRRPTLYHLPRRPIGFPQRFDDGAHVFESSIDGWYDPVPLSREDGDLLSNGYEWESGDGGIRTVLRRAGKSAVAMTPSESYSYSGFLSNRSLMAGLQCAVVCRDDLAVAAAQYLGEVSEKEIRPLIHPNLPEGWRLFTNVLPTRFREAPDGLDSLLVDSAVSIVPSGGLRIGRRWQWLKGAAPVLQVSGLLGGQTVEIDGMTAAVHEGAVELDGLLSSPGLHVVKVGQVERSIEIIEGSVRPRANVTGAVRQQYGVGIPTGSWVLIGKSPGEMHSAARTPFRSVFAAAPFDPVWAIEVGAKSGARAYCLRPSAGPPGSEKLPSNEAKRRAIERWASTIYNANIRRPTLSVCEPTNASTLKELWAAFAECARDLKRRLRRRPK